MLKIKKKLVAEAIKYKTSGEIRFYKPGELQMANNIWERFPEADIYRKVRVREKEAPAVEQRKPREFKLIVEGWRTNALSWDAENPNNLRTGEIIRAREVLPGEVVVTREKLAKAWDEHVWHSITVSKVSPHPFDGLCAALGLEAK